MNTKCWACSPICFEHTVFLVFILRFTPNYMSLKYTCLIEKNNLVKSLYLKLKVKTLDFSYGTNVSTWSHIWLWKYHQRPHINLVRLSWDDYKYRSYCNSYKSGKNPKPNIAYAHSSILNTMLQICKHHCQCNFVDGCYFDGHFGGPPKHTIRHEISLWSTQYEFLGSRKVLQFEFYNWDDGPPPNHGR